MQGKLANSSSAQVLALGNSGGASDFILSTYNPRVALFSTPAASSLASKNNLTIAQLLAPFGRVQCDVSWHEPLNGQLIIPKGLRITPLDVTTQKRVDLDSQANRKTLQDIVARNVPNLVETEESKFPLKNYRNNGKGSSVSYNVEAPENTPWFTGWRERFLKLHAETQSTQYDFLQHYMACIFIMSSTDGQTAEELSETVGKLSKMQQQHQTSWSNTWAFPSVLKFYLIIHEKSQSDQERADAMYQNLRTTYGGNFCFMVQFNGDIDDKNANDTNDHSDLWDPYVEKDVQTVGKELEDSVATDQEVVFNSDVMHPLSPDSEKSASAQFISQNGKIQPDKEIMPSFSCIRGQHLSFEDIKALQTAINEFVSKALLPYIDRQSRLLHESIVNRRGMSKSFFSATKRLFGGSAKTPSSIVYTNESLEMMSRKLADIYFIFGHYAGSYQLYHQLKKDFLGDSAWVYYASSLEMAAVSHFMMSQVEPPLAIPRAFPVHYVTDAITCYIDTCRMSDSAMKCALICCECLKQMGNYSEAAAIYIRMTSEECELKSSLMLEQAAYAFLHVNYIRKYALHCVLAGHRYSKAGLKMHSLKCYLQADQIYAGRGWRFAEDHVHFTIARHQGSLQLTTDISKYLQLLLVTPSPQPINQIQLFYREYITTMAKIGCKETPEFFVPKVISSNICVRIAVSNLHLGEIKSDLVEEYNDVGSWDSLEEQIVKDSTGNSVIFRPSRMMYHRASDNTVHPTVPCQETFYVEIPLHNPLSIPLSVRNIKLICLGSGAAEGNTISQLELFPLEIKVIRFGLRGTGVGSVSFDCITFELESSPVSVLFRQKITLHGARLNSTKKERCGRYYAKDLRNRINVVEKMPLLQAIVQSLPPALYHSQFTEFQLVLADKSSNSEQIQRITEFAVGMDKMNEQLTIVNTSDVKILGTKENFTRFTASFDAESNCTIPCVFKAPASGDSVVIKLLLVYNFRALDASRVNHRIIKISIKVPLLNCLKLEYSSLKLLNATSYVGLIRAHNLTPDGHISIQAINYTKDVFKIQEINSVPVNTAENKNEQAIHLIPMESRNVIFKTTNEQLSLDYASSVLLKLSWNLEKPSISTVSGQSTLVVEDLCRILNLDENLFIFELSHASKCQNNFDANPCFFCGSELLIHSRATGTFNFKMEKNSSQSSSSIGPGSKASGDELVFVGQTSWTLEVVPLKTYNLKYTVAIMQPGVFNIAPTISISGLDDASLVPRKYILHSPLIVAHPS